MKNKRFLIMITFGLLAILLAGCSGTATATSWGGAAVTDEAIFLADGNQVIALNPENGAVLGSAYPEKPTATRLFLSAPVLAGDQLLVADYANTLTSLDPRNITTEFWSFSGATAKYIDSPLVVGNIVVAPNADNNIYAIDLETAQNKVDNALWVFSGDPIEKNEKITKAKGAFWAQPVSDGELVYAPNLDHYLYAVNLATGEKVWKEDLEAPLVARPLLNGEILYIGTLNGDVFAINVNTRTLVWRNKVEGGIWSAPTLVDEQIYFGDQKGNVTIFDLNDGTILDTARLGSAILGSGIVLPDGVAFGKEDGDLVLVPFEGEKQWSMPVGGALYSNIASNGDLFVVVSNKGDNQLIAFRTDGKQSWAYKPGK